MATSWDLFFSYRRHDLDRAQRLLNALAQAGVRVWRDQSDIPDQAAITAEIRQGIANSKAFLAFYSRTYHASNPCQQEITIAWLAAQQIDQNANRRIWIVRTAWNTYRADCGRLVGQPAVAPSGFEDMRTSDKSASE